MITNKCIKILFVCLNQHGIKIDIISTVSDAQSIMVNVEKDIEIKHQFCLKRGLFNTVSDTVQHGIYLPICDAFYFKGCTQNETLSVKS